MHSNSIVGFRLIQCTLGFYVADMIVRLLDNNLQGYRQTIVHHIIAGMGCFIVLFYKGVFAHFAIFRLSSHATIPFVSTFYILLNFNKRKSPVYTVTSIGMVVTSIATRIVPIISTWKIIIGVMIYLYMTCTKASLPHILGIFMFSITFDVGNVIICTKMIRGFIKHVKFIRSKH